MSVTESAPSRAAEILSRPVSINGLTVPNRIAMAPMTRQFSPGGIPGEDVASYYSRRAAAGVGLIVTEGTYVGHDSAGQSSRVPRFHGEEQLAGWAKVAEAVHAAGGTIVPQLWHIGMVREQGQPPYADAPAVGPSGLRIGATEATGRAMDRTDLDAVVGAFAEAAAAAERIGFDGVELHGAHGYLIDQFLWAGTNRRTDAYGGDPVARTRFAAEIIAAVREAVSPEFPVIFRYSQWKQEAYDARLAETPEELEAILTPLAAAGVDAFHASTRRYWLPEFEGSDLNLAGWTKKLTGKAAVTVGSVGLDGDFIRGFMGEGIDDLLDRLERDEFDLVAVGRALLQDPEWAAKVLAGRFDELAPYDAAALKTLS
ncbi:NADH:flavin oxidoreductase [Streptomyces sp. NPDC047082]|uniref:NADH:flavin oxidoreductase n=1 Tax=Streptomyces sp. NPDC047082 TaxID=3155259 RepID=UPI0033D0D09D